MRVVVWGNAVAVPCEMTRASVELSSNSTIATSKENVCPKFIQHVAPALSFQVLSPLPCSKGPLAKVDLPSTRETSKA